MSSADLTTSTLGGSMDAVMHPCSTAEFVVPQALPRVRSKHKSIAYRRALRIECAAGDDSTVWLPKLRTIEAKLPQLDQLFGDARTRLPKARHPWNMGTSAGSQLVSDNIIPENTREPPMPYQLLPKQAGTPTVAEPITLPKPHQEEENSSYWSGWKFR